MLEIIDLAPHQIPPPGYPAIVVEAVPGMTGSRVQQHAEGMYIRCAPALLNGTVAQFQAEAPGTPMRALYIRRAPPIAGRPVPE